MDISKKIQSIAPSLTLEITAKAKRMKAEGISVIGFGAGEPDFNTPDYIIESAKKALDIGFTKYTPASGTVELKKAICEKFKFASLGFQTVDGVVGAIGIDKCKLCTYCWNGKE